MDALHVDTLPIGLARLDPDGCIAAANPAFLDWAGTTAADVVGTKLTDYAVHVVEDLYPDGSGPGPWMMRHVHDPHRAVLVARSPLPNGSLLTVMEASDRFAALMQLRQSYRLADRTSSRLGLVIDASVAFAEAHDESKLADVLAGSTARAYGAEQSVVYLVDERDGFQLAAGENPFAGMLDTESVKELASEVRQVLLLSSAADAEAVSPVLAEAMRRTGVEALLAAPIPRTEGSPYGFFGCFFRHPRQFDQEAAPLAGAFASQAGQALAALRLQRRLAHAAMHDETTGLPNRRLLEEQFTGSTPVWANGIAVIFLDLDGFKRVNDRLGHLAGDEVLRETGRRLQEAVRDGDIVARYGGDEFVVVCEVADPATAHEIAERLRESVQRPFRVAGSIVNVGASIGVALAASHRAGLSADQLVRAADQAMYRAKSRGGNLVVHDGEPLASA